MNLSGKSNHLLSLFRRDLSFGCYVLLAAVAMAVPLVSWLYLYPPPAGDAVAFIPAAVNYQATGELVNPLNPLSFNADPLNAGRFVYYPPLFPWLTGLLMVTDTAFNAFGVVAFYRTTAIFLLALILWQYVRKADPGRFRFLLSLVAAAGVIGYAGMRLPGTGRPEALAELFLLGSLASYLWMRPRCREWAYGLLLGLTGATQPAGAIFLGLGMAMEIASRRPARKAVIHTTGVLGTGMALCAGIIALSPNGLAATLEGMFYHQGLLGERAVDWLSVSAGNFTKTVVRYWFFWWDRAFFGMVALFALVWFGRLPWKQPERVRSRLMYVILYVILLVAVWYFGLRIPPTSYNIGLFYPLFLTAVIGWISRKDLEERHGAYLRLAAVLLMVGLPMTALLKYGTEGIAAQRAQKGYHDARKVASEVAGSYQRIYFTKGLWALFDGDEYPGLWRIEFNWPEGKPVPEGDAAALVSAQDTLREWETGVDSFVRPRLVRDWMADHRPSLFGVEVTSYVAGYSFRVYEPGGQD